MRHHCGCATGGPIVFLVALVQSVLIVVFTRFVEEIRSIQPIFFRLLFKTLGAELGAVSCFIPSFFTTEVLTMKLCSQYRLSSIIKLSSTQDGTRKVGLPVGMPFWPVFPPREVLRTSISRYYCGPFNHAVKACACRLLLSSRTVPCGGLLHHYIIPLRSTITLIVKGAQLAVLKTCYLHSLSIF